ncbi:DNA-directed RNA polymerase [Polychytrium aggregatum]|uniref:DNA-directed RNA polymerase n=1 Tax=Polychytrium aggregatum TaxID=110093 RepID=UPI0022FE7E63|nr:DNA-directed RNA polymerase [Polychytrium aggregatum]KAI9204155.1 DNA-directed RNA polymerase [Polychytrium aggregatum]
MSNAPDRHELFLIPDGEKKVSMVNDTKFPNVATFTFLREDHTIGNLIRMQLLKNPKVLFAGYKIPHPLEHNFVLKIQTTPDTSPLDVLRQEFRNLETEINSIKTKFENELTLHGMSQTNDFGDLRYSSNVDRNF